MKRTKSLLAIVGALALSLSSIAGELKVGATPVPHSELLNLVKNDLKKDGVDLKVVEFTDYITPNIALAEGAIDANFFQHLPYLNKFISERKLDLISAGKIHVEPLGLYSTKYKKLEDIPKKSVIAIPNDPSNGGRALILLHNAGIIELKDPTNLYATEFDIVKNPKKLRFKPLEAPQLPRVLKDVGGAVINGNYALEAGLSPLKDSLLLEGEESPYVNIVAIKRKDKDNEDIHKLIKALQSEKVREYILENYNGGVVATF